MWLMVDGLSNDNSDGTPCRTGQLWRFAQEPKVLTFVSFPKSIIEVFNVQNMLPTIYGSLSCIPCYDLTNLSPPRAHIGRTCHNRHIRHANNSRLTSTRIMEDVRLVYKNPRLITNICIPNSPIWHNLLSVRQERISKLNRIAPTPCLTQLLTIVFGAIAWWGFPDNI